MPLKSAPKIQVPVIDRNIPPVAAPKDIAPPPDVPPLVAEPQVVMQTLPPTTEQVQAAWDSFANQYKQNGKPLVVSMLTWKPIMFQYPVITHSLRTNATDMDAFKEVRNELLGFLKKQLNHSQLTLEIIEVAATDTSTAQKIYTNTDKFNFLAAQNPLLNDLRNLLGLDIE
jgi:hypothetical protein